MACGVRLFLVVLALFGATPLYAVQVDEILPDPVLEARARDISHELRCMVCQNQSIDDSEAPLARDLRLLVRERLRPATATPKWSISWWRAMASSSCSSPG